jgi:hypothetical protein
MRKMGFTEIQKQTIAQRLRDGISIRAIDAEVGVDKRGALEFPSDLFLVIK